jgi:hypothetical protein
LPQPIGRGFKEGSCHLQVGDTFKKPEKAGYLIIMLIIEVVDVRRDAPGGLPLMERQEILGFAYLEERPVAGVQEFPLIRENGGHPIGIVPVNSPGQPEEFP